MAQKSRYTFVRLADNMPDHPKVVGLSDGAFRLYVSGICYCSRFSTDGSVPKAALRSIGTSRAAKELVTAGLWITTDDGWLVHDYTDHQRSAAEIEEQRDRWRKKKAGQRSVSPGDTTEKPAGPFGESPESPTSVLTAVVSGQWSEEELQRTGPESLINRVDDPERDPRVVVAVELLASEDVADRKASKGKPIADDIAYLARCRQSRWDRDGMALAVVAKDYPDLDAPELVEAFKQREREIEAAF